MSRPMSKVTYLVLFTLTFSGAVNLITALPGGASLYTLYVVLFLIGAAIGIYCYGELEDSFERERDVEIAEEMERPKGDTRPYRTRMEIERGIRAREKKRLRKYKWWVGGCLTVAVIVFVGMVVVERGRRASEMQDMRSQIIEIHNVLSDLQGSTISRTSQEDRHRTSAESALKAIGQQVDELPTRWEDDLTHLEGDIAALSQQVEKSSQLVVSASYLDQTISRLNATCEQQHGAQNAVVRDLRQRIDKVMDRLEYLVSKNGAAQHSISEPGDSEAPHE